MGLLELRLSMLATLAIIIGLSTLVLTAVLILLGVFDIITLGIIVVAINVVQWLIAPYLVGAIYKVRKLSEAENPQLHQIVSNLSQKCGINKPQLMLAQIPIPNAFAYGSPLTGSRVAVTPGLLSTLNMDEVEAVIGHELGHLRHKDVQIMMAVSFLPALFMYVGYTMMFSSLFSSGSGSRRGGGGGGGYNAIIGIAFMAFSYVLTLFTLYLSRLREYYADRNSASVVENGASKLSTGLAKIVNATKKQSSSQRGFQRRGQQQQQNIDAFKALFITDPDRASTDQAAIRNMDASGMVQEILSKKLTFTDRLVEALSTHPNIVKRLRVLQQLSQNPNA
jgi:heat shock protein HtpX